MLGGACRVATARCLPRGRTPRGRGAACRYEPSRRASRWQSVGFLGSFGRARRPGPAPAERWRRSACGARRPGGVRARWCSNGPMLPRLTARRWALGRLPSPRRGRAPATAGGRRAGLRSRAYRGPTARRPPPGPRCVSRPRVRRADARRSCAGTRGPSVRRSGWPRPEHGRPRCALLPLREDSSPAAPEGAPRPTHGHAAHAGERPRAPSSARGCARVGRERRPRRPSRTGGVPARWPVDVGRVRACRG